ncbi:hypothetical protein TRV_02007 [Trichophyton verrucosum HKI 0517]|uniref:Uncharacterized protein n=1 Tax=Trichophyton verrucosum (strain HKI 0517) TaxID=663202 RepID=D4D4J0_TRIVH|nr:uncharacterized protein TRV_02007 [Trichophyton verrucosum HKI 0517]EFE43192.1 hypothetical protein TRV_02007 [Trichophyton verrucosum HKI 0517]
MEVEAAETAEKKKKQSRNRNAPRDEEDDARHGCCSRTVSSPTRGRHLPSGTPSCAPGAAATASLSLPVTVHRLADSGLQKETRKSNEKAKT